MPNLKDLRVRIASVKSTQKITSAMKMVAAAKLRRSQDAAVAARPYAERMDHMLGRLAVSVAGQAGVPKLLSGSGKEDVTLVVVATADRGLCGGFNSSIVRAARRKIRDLQQAGKTVRLFCVGRKGADVLRREFENIIVERITGVDRPKLEFAKARGIAQRLAVIRSKCLGRALRPRAYRHLRPARRIDKGDRDRVAHQSDGWGMDAGLVAIDQ